MRSRRVMFSKNRPRPLGVWAFPDAPVATRPRRLRRRSCRRPECRS